MKTTKVLIFASLLVFTSVSLSNAGGFEKPKTSKIVVQRIINISLMQAVGVPGLPAAMLLQLNQEEVTGCDCTNITVDVTLGNVIYRISGSKQQWTLFFKTGGIWWQEGGSVVYGEI